MRALPEQFSAPVAAVHADVRIDVEDRVAGEVHVAIDQRAIEVQVRERLPDRLVEGERVRVDDERLEQEIEGAGRVAVRALVAREREARTPVLRDLVDQAAAIRVATASALRTARARRA